MALEAVPGFIELNDAHHETTIVVSPAELVAAGLAPARRARLRLPLRHHRRRLPRLGRQGRLRLHRDPRRPRPEHADDAGAAGAARPKPKRFALNYHLLSIVADGGRIRLQTWVDDGEPVPSVIEVWPTADWHEREAYDMLGINIVGHPNLKRILMDDDWEGHPLRKDYPIGGEPVRFSGEE